MIYKNNYDNIFIIGIPKSAIKNYAFETQTISAGTNTATFDLSFKISDTTKCAVIMSGDGDYCSISQYTDYTRISFPLGSISPTQARYVSIQVIEFN